MSLTRRQFIKTLTAMGVVAVLPPIPLPEDNRWPRFDPTTEWGDYILSTGVVPEPQSVEELIDESLDLFIDQIALSVPPQYRHNVVWTVRAPKPLPLEVYDRVLTFGWKYSPNHTWGPKVIVR